MKKFKRRRRRKPHIFYITFKHPKIVKLAALGVFTILISFVLLLMNALPVSLPAIQQKTTGPAADTIKWVDFDVPYSVLEKAMYMDIQTYQAEVHINWIDTLSYLGAKYGGNFRNYKVKDMDNFFEKIKNGEDIQELTKDMKYFDYYRKAYGAVLGGFLGEFKIQVPVDEESKKKSHEIDLSEPDIAGSGNEGELGSTGAESDGNIVWQTKYGLKAFSPIAAGYWYNDFDDFGSRRSYGYNRKHFGHDLMISTGAPVIAVESGIVEALGWNQYGGWRIGIRSYDKQRYYYYAHLRKDRPYSAGLHIGQAVNAGDVIGYTGRTGYSAKENVNNIDTPHLHYGMQLIFDESLKDSPNQIWVDLYSITRLLSKNKSSVYKNEETKEYYRKYDFSEPSYFQQLENIREYKMDGLKVVDSRGEASSDNGTNSDDISTLSDLSTVALMGSGAPEGSIRLPIIMYHGVLDNASNGNKFFISAETFENDLKYLRENSYNPIFMKDLIDYVDRGVPLPEKPIVLTFDDGYYNNYLYAFPLLKEYNMKAVISILGKTVDKYSQLDETNPVTACLTWDNINEMIASGYIEIQNHSYNMHSMGKGRDGTLNKAGESIEAYTVALNEDIGYLQHRIQQMTGQTPTTFTYPYGFVTDKSKEALNQMGFKATLTCYEKMNYITRDPDSLYRLKRFLRPPNKSSEQFFKAIAPPHTSS